MKILVTGSSGFLGTTLCAFLERQGCQIVRLTSRNCDLRSVHNLQRFSDTRYDSIVHLAA